MKKHKLSSPKLKLDMSTVRALSAEQRQAVYAHVSLACQYSVDCVIAD